MNATLLYRIASGLLVVFAASHTSGLLTFDESSSEVRGVREAMDHVHFQLMGSNCSYGGFYVGFGLLLTAYLLFSAFLAWHLGGLARRNPQAIGALAWSLFTVQVVNLALSWTYFFPAPVAMSAPRGHLPGLGRVAGHGSKGQGITQVEFEHGWPREVRNDDHWDE